MNGPAGIFYKMNVLLVMLEYVPFQTLIRYSKNGREREKYNVVISSSGRYLDNLNNMHTDPNIFHAITFTELLNVRCLSKIIPKNLILLVSSIVADPSLISVKCNIFLHEKIIYFVLSALIQIRFYVSQLLILLRSWLRVNVNSRAFSSANEVDRVLSSANSINCDKDDELGRSFINNRNNNGPRKDPCGTPWLIEDEEEVIPSITVIWFLSLRYDLAIHVKLF